MEEHVYLITIGILFGTIALVFGIRAYASVQQAKARIASETTYRVAAEKATAVQAETTATLAAIQVALQDMQTRLASVERLLKDVE